MYKVGDQFKMIGGKNLYEITEVTDDVYVMKKEKEDLSLEFIEKDKESFNNSIKQAHWKRVN